MERQQFILFIEPVRPEMPVSPTEDEIRIVGDHFAYLQREHEAGNVILVGRTLAEPFVGIAIFEANDMDEAERFAQDDPGVQSGVFKLVRVQPYKVALIR